MTLYELGEQYRALLEMSEDEIPEDVLADTLDGLKGEIEAKADGICCLIKELSAGRTACGKAQSKGRFAGKAQGLSFERAYQGGHERL